MKQSRYWRPSAFAAAATALAVLSSAVAIAAQPGPAQSAADPLVGVPQLEQAGAAHHPVSLSASGGTAGEPRRLCQDGAVWVRPHFSLLSLRGSDTVTVRADGGESFTLTAAHGQNRAVSTRSFPGPCVTITADLADPASRYEVGSVQAGSTQADVLVAGAGDICGSYCSDTADVVRSVNPAAVFTTGDNAYENGSLNDYRTRYDPAWGQFKSITRPSPGNHEYQTSGASGYFDYFNGVGNNTGPAGERGKGYYSYDVGDWHMVALNSNVSMSAGSAQETWLRNDLKASTKPCTAAYWHHPLFTRGSHSNATGTRPLWQALYDHKADLILVGHDHNYQRYAPQRPDGTADSANGIRQILVGTGGRAFYNFTRTMPNVESSNANTYGIVKLALSSTGYTGDFVPVAGSSFSDRFSGQCKSKGTAPAPDFALSASPSSVSVEPGATATTRVTVTSSGGFAGDTSLAVSGLPTGVTATVEPNPVRPPANGSAAATVTLSATVDATPGTSTVTVRGTSGALAKQTTFSLTVQDGGQPSDFTIGASPSSVTVRAGQSASTSITSTAGSGGPETISLNASGLPAGVQAQFQPASIETGTSAKLAFEASATAQAGRYQVTVTGRNAAGTTATAAVSLTVEAGSPTPGDVTVTVTPTSGSTWAGGFAQTQIGASGGTGALTLSASGVPAGTSVYFGSRTLEQGGSTTTYFFTGSSTPVGSHPITITATAADGKSGTATFTLTVTRFGGFSADPRGSRMS